MAGSESHVLEVIQYPSGQSPLLKEVEGKPQVASLIQERPKSEVPKFGAWEGGENYTVYFDNARKKRTNGQMINPNDRQENPEMFQHNGGPGQAPRADPKGQPAKVPQFGAWENGENVGYTAYFENKRKGKNGEPTAAQNEPKTNRDMHPRKDSPAQARPALAKPELQRAARSKVPQFGAWEGAGEAGYTQSFDNVRKNKNRQQAEGFTRAKGERRELVNEARFPLLDEGLLAERVGALAGANDPHVYGGSKSLTIGQRGGNGNNVNQLGVTSRGFPISTAGSNSALRKATEVFQPNQGAKKSQVSITNAGMILNNDTPESYYLPTHHINQKEKKGSCFPWFGRGGVKSFSFLKQ